MIYSAQKPPQTITFPVVKAVKITKDLQTLLDLQTLGITKFTLDIGAPASATMVVRFDTPSGPVTVYADNVLVRLGPESYTTYPTQEAFLADYDVL